MPGRALHRALTRPLVVRERYAVFQLRGWGQTPQVIGNQHLCVLEEMKAPVGNPAQGRRGGDAGLGKASPSGPLLPKERRGSPCRGKDRREPNLLGPWALGFIYIGSFDPGL